MLGTVPSQVSVEEDGSQTPAVGVLAVAFEVRTLEHAPAVRELDALSAKISVLSYQTLSSSRRWWTDVLPNTRFVSFEVRGRSAPSGGAAPCATCVQFEIDMDLA